MPAMTATTQATWILLKTAKLTQTNLFSFPKSKDNGKSIFRHAFPPKYTNKNHRSDKWYQDFCDRFSRIFAEKSAGTVYFVAPSNTEIDDSRVWKRIEYSALVNNAAVVKIVQVNDKVDWSGMRCSIGIYTSQMMGKRSKFAS